MKLNKLIAIVICLFIVSCNKGITNESTTVRNDSSTSFIENESKTNSETKNEFFEIEGKINLSEINLQQGLTPSTGDVDILLIPIHFQDISKNKMDINLLNKEFNSENDDDVEWYSVAEYYKISSYNKLNLNFTLTETYTPSHPSSYYTSYYSDLEFTDASDSIVIEALTYFNNSIDFSQYDSNDDGYIDGVYLVYDRPVDYTYHYSLWWAYTYYFTNEEVLFDNLKVKSYVFAGYDFLKENKQICNTHTLIHETAHLFGLDDYYDYIPSSGTTKGGLAGADIMDETIGDHNALSKALLGWNKGKVITTEATITIDLPAFSLNGDYLILSNNFDANDGLLQEYFILEYYTPSSLNEMDKMFTINGIRVLHVIANIKKDGSFKYNNSTSIVKFISQITSENGSTYISNTTKRSDDTLFIENESLNSVKYANGDSLSYKFRVDKLTENNATITISKI